MTMRKAFVYALLPAGTYLSIAELLYLWYETSLAADKPGIGVLLGGGLSFLMAMPGSILLDVSGSTEFSQRLFEMQASIAVTAAIMYAFVLVPLLLAAAGARKNTSA